MADEWKAPKTEVVEDEDRKSWKLLEKTLLAGVQEQRRARRWGIFFKLLTFLYLFGILFLFSPLMSIDSTASRSDSHTALVEVRGIIADQEAASADNIVKSLREAFKDAKTKAVVMRINSPGGSPVQSGYVYDEIRRLRAEYPQIKLYAVIADLGASGAYYIASAADEIYADKASLVGSIGVTAAGYGFVGAMDKLGWSVVPTPPVSTRRFLIRSRQPSLKRPSSGRVCSTRPISSSLPWSSRVAASA